MRPRDAGVLGSVGDLRARMKRVALEHPVLFVAGVALAVRLVIAIAVTVTVDIREQFPDAGGYDLLASERVSGAFRDWDDAARRYYNKLSGYLLPLTVLYWLFGAHLFLGQLLAAAFGMVTAAIVCRLIQEVAPTRWALFGGLVVALFPSAVLWSSVPLKDSAVWAALSATALVALWAARAQGRRLALCGLALAGLLFWLGHLRLPTSIISAWALVLAALFSTGRGRITRMAGAVTLLLLVPWYLGLGPAGVDYVNDYSPDDVRVDRAQGAETALVDAGDEGGLAYLPHGLSVVLLEPYPWTRLSGYEVRVAQIELLLWYPLLVAGVTGIPALVRKRRELAFVGISGGAILLVFALYEGNFGTALRHRSELLPGLAVLAALGAPVLLGRWRRFAISHPAPARSAPSP